MSPSVTSIGPGRNIDASIRTARHPSSAGGSHRHLGDATCPGREEGQDHRDGTDRDEQPGVQPGGPDPKRKIARMRGEGVLRPFGRRASEQQAGAAGDEQPSDGVLGSAGRQDTAERDVDDDDEDAQRDGRIAREGVIQRKERERRCGDHEEDADAESGNDAALPSARSRLGHRVGSSIRPHGEHPAPSSGSWPRRSSPPFSGAGTPGRSWWVPGRSRRSASLRLR